MSQTLDTVNLLIDTPVPGLRVISFHNPARKNAINRATYIGLRQAIDEASADAAVQVIALTGHGEYFSSGNDLGNMPESLDNLDAYLDDGVLFVRRLVHAFVRCPKLLVAVVNGPAIGIAATIVALCDVVYASETAYFHTPFTALGLCAEGCSSYTFPRRLGPSKAAELLLLNHRMDAAEALRFGFVSDVFSAAELQSTLWPRIRQWPSLAHESLRTTRRLMRQAAEPELLSACEQELVALRERMTSDEAIAAVMQFMNRRTRSKL